MGTTQQERTATSLPIHSLALLGRERPRRITPIHAPIPLASLRAFPIWMQGLASGPAPALIFAWPATGDRCLGIASRIITSTPSLPPTSRTTPCARFRGEQPRGADGDERTTAGSSTTRTLAPPFQRRSGQAAQPRRGTTAIKPWMRGVGPFPGGTVSMRSYESSRPGRSAA